MVGWSSPYDAGPGAAMDVRARLLVWHAGLLLRRAARQRRRLLVRELAGYTTPAELDDLQAAVDRCPEAQTQELRALLDAQRRRQLGPHGHRAA
jgi:hypothetical protein